MQDVFIKCPFCDNNLTKFNWHANITDFACIDDNCNYHSQSRYIESWDPDKIVRQTFMIDKFHVKVDFQNNVTTICELEIIILINPVVIPRAQIFNLKNYDESLDKLKLMLTFS